MYIVLFPSHISGNLSNVVSVRRPFHAKKVYTFPSGHTLRKNHNNVVNVARPSETEEV